MSGFQTHALVGGVGGLGLVTYLERTHAALLPQLGGSAALLGIPGGVGGAAVIAASAFLALVPDIDEPQSFVAQRVRAVLLLVGLALGIALGILAHGPVWLPLAAGAVGGAAGLLAGRWLLKGIRAAAGGHRRFTHSLVLAGMLALLAGGLWRTGMGIGWLIPAAFAWGIVLHDLADLVTPAGLPLLFPLSDASIRVLPEPICRYGEPLIAVAALAAGWLLLRG
ncbi:hypothetical protein EKD04_017985 [Chloroflexales bacterium ZM16-3]|nr:hypothetical protein [Chloroflexales bacterium ZM16-3]